MEGSVAIMEKENKLSSAVTKFDMRGHDSIVRYVIEEFCEGHPNNLARRLTFSPSNMARKEPVTVTRQQVDGWINRKQFPREWIIPIHYMFKVPLRPLIGDDC